MDELSRRRFLEKSLTLSTTLAVTHLFPSYIFASASSQFEQNDLRNSSLGKLLRVAVVGVNNRGKELINACQDLRNIDVSVICDVDENVIGDAMRLVEKHSGKKPRYVVDFRKVLEDKKIDAVFLATPNHWHCLQMVWATQAGKDVYVEKPLSHTVWEGQKMVEAARKYSRIVQCGTQLRSSPGVHKALQFLHSGRLGKVTTARIISYFTRKSIGHHIDMEAPQGVNYSLWLGPARIRPFNLNRYHGSWRWNWDYGNGHVGNHTIHQIDVARWGLQKMGLPQKVLTVGGRFGYEDDGETPNSGITWVDYGDSQIVFEFRGLPTTSYQGLDVGNIFHCSAGTLIIGKKGSFALNLKGERICDFGDATNHEHNTRAHIKNFVEAVRNRKGESLNAEAEEGHFSSTICHLSNISYRLGERRGLDTKEKLFLNHDIAAEAYKRMRIHLKDSGVDFRKTPYVFGKELQVDTKKQTLIGDFSINKLLTHEYRAPFVMPQNI